MTDSLIAFVSFAADAVNWYFEKLEQCKSNIEASPH